VVIEEGILKSYLLNTYTAKKLGLETTGERFPRISRHARHWARQLLPTGRQEDAAADYR